MKGLLRAFLVLATATAIFFAVAPERSSHSDAAEAVPSRIAEIERLVFDATNAERRRQGLEPFQADTALAKIGRNHSADMLRRGFFSHGSPEGVRPADRIAIGHRTLIGISGENIWSGSGYHDKTPAELARIIVDNWMKSPGHRKNILRDSFTHLGVGIAESGREIRATQSFAGERARLVQPVAPRIKADMFLDFRTVSYGPQLFALWSKDRQGIDGEPQQIVPGQLTPLPLTPPGDYVLHFYFLESEAGSYSIFYGPAIEVTD